MKPLTTILSILALALCISACSTPTRYVASRGFTFDRYDYIVSGPGGGGWENKYGGRSQTMFGLDIDINNYLASYNFNIVGYKEYESLTPQQQARTLDFGVSVASSIEQSVLTVSFNDAVTGRTMASFTQTADGDITDIHTREEILGKVMEKMTEIFSDARGLDVNER
jgi:hypothetical protein